jgi:hypothetical protein
MLHSVESQGRFDCSACGKDYDRASAVSECRMCHRAFCAECIDDQGVCVPCEEGKSV